MAEAQQYLKSYRLQWRTHITHKLIDKLLEIEMSKSALKKAQLKISFEEYFKKARLYTGQLFGIGAWLQVSKWHNDAEALVPIQKAMLERYGIEHRVLTGKAAEGLGRQTSDEFLVEYLSELTAQARMQIVAAKTKN